MHKISLFIIVSCVCCAAFVPQTQLIAPFKIRLTNGNGFTYKDLKKNTATAIVYFEPGCEHCKDFVKELVKYENMLINKQIIFITYSSLDETKRFDSFFNISSKPYFKIGSEGYTFVVQKYYNIQKFPYIVLYNNQLKLVKKLLSVERPGALAKEVVNFN
jgi:thiol-disulfide isomerase/thioredoxin